MSNVMRKRELVEDGLRRALDGVRPAAKVDAQWNFVPPVDGLARGTASLEEDWLVLSVPVASRSWIRASFQKGGHWSLAVQTGELDGGSKLRVVDDAPTLHLRNEIWVGDGRRAAAAIVAGCGLFREGASCLIDRRVGPALAAVEAAPLPSPDGSMQVPDPVQLKDLAIAGGWSLEERGAGDLVHNLDLGQRGAYQLRLRVEPDGHLHAWTAVLSEQELEPASRRALGLLLARANDRLRLVRGAVHPERDRDSVRFEIVQPMPCGPEQVELVLSALTTACWKCGPEIRLLADHDVARRYLESFGVAQW